MDNQVSNDIPVQRAKVQQKRHDWMVMYEALIRFGEEQGHCNVPLRYPRVKVNEYDSAHLGAWLATQRREHLNGKMKPERLVLMQKLVDSNMLEWSPLNHSKQSEQTWPLMYECLKMYCKERQLEHPGSEVSSIPETRKWKHPDGWEVGLGRWMHTQNKQRRAGKLRPDRCAKMEELVKAGMFRWPTQRVLKTNGAAKLAAASSSSSSSAASSSAATGSARAGSSTSRFMGGGKDDFNASDNGKGEVGGKARESRAEGKEEGPPPPDRSAGTYRLRKAPQKSTNNFSYSDDTSSSRASKRSRPNNYTTTTTDASGSLMNFGGFGGRVGSGAFLGPLYSLAIPAAGMQYARQLSAQYTIKAAESRKDGEFDIIFPLPSLQKINDNNAASNPLSMQEEGMIAKAFEVNPNEPLPLPFTMKMGEMELTQELKEQVQAQILATLVMDLAEENPDNLEEVVEQLATAAVDTLERDKKKNQ
jgi:hypothetical protein